MPAGSPQASATGQARELPSLPETAGATDLEWNVRLGVATVSAAGGTRHRRDLTAALGTKDDDPGTGVDVRVDQESP
jgi:hypothetical protein